MCEYKTKSDRRDSKRKNKDNKWIKHQYGENWGKSHGEELSTSIKKMIKEKTKISKKIKK